MNLQLVVGGGTKEIYLDFNALNLFLCWIKKTKQNIATLLFLFSLDLGTKETCRIATVLSICRFQQMEFELPQIHRFGLD